MLGFNGHPPLGVNATEERRARELRRLAQFQWAPTLGGECYGTRRDTVHNDRTRFNGHPPLGVNATFSRRRANGTSCVVSIGTHPWG